MWGKMEARETSEPERRSEITIGDELRFKEKRGGERRQKEIMEDQRQFGRKYGCKDTRRI
jgi:hypothetical protein